jgi:type IV pilus assembly protein PilM
MRLARRSCVRWWSSIRGATRTLALDIGSHSVKLVAVRRDASALRVEATAIREMPGGAVQGHVLRDPAPVADVLRAIVRDAGVRTRLAVAALPGAAVMMRRIPVQVAAGEDLDGVVVRASSALVPDSLDHAVLDYHVIGAAATDGTRSVLVVAARRDLVRSFTTAMCAAGLEPSGLDVDVFALDRLHRAARNGERHGTPAVLVHVGARRADVIVAGADGPVFMGDVPLEGGLIDAPSLAREIHRAIDLSAVEPAVSPRSIVLSGGAAAAAGLGPALERRLGCPVALAEPFRSVALGPRVDRGQLASSGAAFAVAMGLALRDGPR